MLYKELCKNQDLFIHVDENWESNLHLNKNESIFPANKRRLPSAGLMLGQRRWRWANIKPALGEHIVFAGLPGCHRD